MKKPFLVAACILTVSGLYVGPCAAQKPVTTLISRPTPMPAPESTEMLWWRADAVVSARVIGNTVRERHFYRSQSDPDLATEYSFHVSEVLKQSEQHKITGKVSVLFPGGVKEYPDRILVTKQEGFPPLDGEASVILFLRWSSSDEAYIPLYGPEGVFVESGEVIKSPGQSPMAKANVGKHVGKFREELRAIGKKK